MGVLPPVPGVDLGGVAGVHIPHQSQITRLLILDHIYAISTDMASNMLKWSDMKEMFDNAI